MGFTINKMTKFLNKYKTQLGLTLLEALISTAIIGIGFVAIFQMVNFSVQSIDSSSERTKANYLVSMIAEDIIAHKITDTSWEGIAACAQEKDTIDTIELIYTAEVEDAEVNKKNKWDKIFKNDRYLKCKSEKDIKNVKIFKICKWDHCEHQEGNNYFKNEDVYDDGLFIGRVQINMNDGKKRRFLYFTADYQLKK